MTKTRHAAQREPAQPLLAGINLARFLCDACPFYKMGRRDVGPKGNCSAVPPSDAVGPASEREFEMDHGDKGKLGSL